MSRTIEQHATVGGRHPAALPSVALPALIGADRQVRRRHDPADRPPSTDVANRAGRLTGRIP